MTVLVETIALDLTDTQRAAAIGDLAAFISEAQEHGLDVTILAVEATPRGDAYTIEVDGDEPHALLAG